ncbi:hypothetical protein [Actinomadura macrotermitis]|uniref:hypothetical protein n=1 Tax=Actinomadura macrotermitis TaxID=2585200 RepID=UPI00129735CE|nr:hypothetical protein [Actinomadura macrotermitis]
MPDVVLWTTLVTTAGAAGSALGAVALADRQANRRERRQQEEKEAARRRARRAELDAERRALWSRVLKTSARVEADVRMLGDGYRADLRARMAVLHDEAVTVAEETALAAALYAAGPGGERAAHAARQVAAATAGLVVALGNAIVWDEPQNGEPAAGGNVNGEVDFTGLDTWTVELQRALGPVLAGGDAPEEEAPDESALAGPVRARRQWPWSRPRSRSASSP